MKKDLKVQIVLAGVGGQGILFASKIFSNLGMRMGLNVLGSETHGMSQRGGSVITHLKLGDFRSPLIRTGAADILYSLDKNETYRALKFLKKGGICFTNLDDSESIDKRVLDHLKKKSITFIAYDASRTAEKIGSILSANIVLLGYSVGTGLVPFAESDIRKVLRAVGRERIRRLNIKSFKMGFKDGEYYLS
ncbi:MAG: indolepyruvate oxidoreductase subunit beta [Candidatus Aminicenantes bacterium]|jgi:indolepyruvate ferredoxin oxidoreductase beta subunit